MIGGELKGNALGYVCMSLLLGISQPMEAVIHCLYLPIRSTSCTESIVNRSTFHSQYAVITYFQATPSLRLEDRFKHLAILQKFGIITRGHGNHSILCGSSENTTSKCQYISVLDNDDYLRDVLENRELRGRSMDFYAFFTPFIIGLGKKLSGYMYR